MLRKFLLIIETVVLPVPPLPLATEIIIELQYQFLLVVFLEYFVLRWVVLSEPLNEHSYMLLLLVHIVREELLQRGIFGGIYPLLIKIYGFQFLSEGFSGSLKINMLGVKFF